MNSNLLGWTAVCASVIAFKLAHHLVKPLSLKWRAGWFAILGICGIPAVLFAVYYLHVLPERAWFYELRSWRGSEFLAVPLGATAGCLAAMLPRKFVPVILLLSIACAAVPYVKPLLVPLPSTAIHDQWDGSACLQSTPSTCGPASTATILSSLGCPASEKEVARKAFTYAGGTEAWYLARYVRSQGLKARFDFRPELPADLKLPAMIGVKLGGFGHFIPVLSREGDILTIADPLHGMETISLADLKKRCQPTGFHLSISND
jgi:hypothetical protein